VWPAQEKYAASALADPYDWAADSRATATGFLRGASCRWSVAPVFKVKCGGHGRGDGKSPVVQKAAWLPCDGSIMVPGCHRDAGCQFGAASPFDVVTALPLILGRKQGWQPFIATVALGRPADHHENSPRRNAPFSCQPSLVPVRYRVIAVANPASRRWLGETPCSDTDFPVEEKSDVHRRLAIPAAGTLARICGGDLQMRR